MGKGSTNGVNRLIGLRIRAIRLERGLTREELSERLDISPGEIERYEEGLASIHAARLRTFALAFGCPMDAFFRPEPAPEQGTAARAREMPS